MAEGLAVTRDGAKLPMADVLAGRGFITGKSGSGKSNTASVVVEELLDAGRPVLIIDMDGEYYGLRERYELLCVGDAPECDRPVGPEHAQALARLALEENVPIVVDVSATDPDEAGDLIAAVVTALFEREREIRKPFLLVAEEVHEYLPEKTGLDDAGEALLRVAKRGRKRGLGLLGVSQRPAAVDKDFITQCDWLVWHRLTWSNDTKVVARILGDEAAEMVTELETGEALLRADWEEELKRVRVREKRTFDAGSTPDLDGGERPTLRSPDDALMEFLDDAASGYGSSADDPLPGSASTNGAGDGTSAEKSNEATGDSNGAGGSEASTASDDAASDSEAATEAGSDNVGSADALPETTDDADLPAAELDDVEDLRAELARRDDRITKLEAELNELREETGVGAANRLAGRSNGSTRTTPKSSPQGGPVWEFGQLVAHLAVLSWRGLVNGCKRLHELGRSYTATTRRKNTEAVRHAPTQSNGGTHAESPSATEYETVSDNTSAQDYETENGYEPSRSSSHSEQ